MKSKYALWVGAGMVGAWYMLLFVTSSIQAGRPRTYGEDLTGTGVLFLIPVGIILLLMPSAVLGLITAAIYQANSKKTVAGSTRFGFCLTVFCILSVPLLVLLSMYTIADM